MGGIGPSPNESLSMVPPLLLPLPPLSVSVGLGMGPSSVLPPVVPASPLLSNEVVGGGMGPSSVLVPIGPSPLLPLVLVVLGGGMGGGPSSIGPVVGPGMGPMSVVVPLSLLVVVSSSPHAVVPSVSNSAAPTVGATRAGLFGGAEGRFLEEAIATRCGVVRGLSTGSMKASPPRCRTS